MEVASRVDGGSPVICERPGGMAVTEGEDLYTFSTITTDANQQLSIASSGCTSQRPRSASRPWPTSIITK